MKTHIKGTNNRTFCGNKITNNTNLLKEGQELYITDCARCRGRLADDFKYMDKCLKTLKNLSNDSVHCNPREDARDAILTSPEWRDNGILKQDKIYCLGRYVNWEKGDEKICLDGEFTPEELEAYAWWLRNGGVE